MDISEKQSTTDFSTTSNLSTWVGPDILTQPDAVSSVRGDDAQIKFEAADWTKRLLCLSDANQVGRELGPGISPDYGFHDVLEIMKGNYLPYQTMAPHYTGFRYDSIEIRVTISAPKALVGGLFVGWYPFVDYFDETVKGTIDVYLDNDFGVNCIPFLNSANTQFMFLSEAADCVFTIPWTFKYPYMPTSWILAENSNGSQDQRPCTGWPIIFWKLAQNASYVSTIAMAATFEVYAKFNNPRFVGPINWESFEKQSGLEPLGAAALGAAAETGLSYIASVLSDSSETSSVTSVTSQNAPGTYAEPQAVQMSYFGDTTTVGFPEAKPIFRGEMTMPSHASVPSVHDYLSRPQYLFSGHTGEGLWRVPITPNYSSSTKTGYSMFDYFSLVNQYWRGTLIYEIMIANHDFIECFLEVSVSFPGGSTGTIDQVPTLRTVFSGSKRVTVPVPYLFPLDYMPIADEFNESPYVGGLSAYLHINLVVRSTMLNVSPSVPFYVFLRAGPDFKFYQPYPPGLYHMEDDLEMVRVPRQEKADLQVVKAKPSSTKAKNKNKNKNKKETKAVKQLTKADFYNMQKQIFLPLADETELADMGASITPDPGVLAACDTVYDYMKVWSRCVSFIDYDNDGDEEPIPNPSIGLSSPCWFPPVDRSRFATEDNSWFCTIDYVSYFSHLFLYWRGSIATKVAVSQNRTEPATYVYASLSAPAGRQPARAPWSFAPSDLPPDANFGAGAVATPVELQPVFELSIPYRGFNVWGYCIYNAYSRGICRGVDIPPPLVRNNIQTVNDDGVLADSTYRKIDADFALCQESVLPPVSYWRNRGHSF